MTNQGYRRVHRLTPLLRFWTLILALLAIVGANLNEALLNRISSAIRGEDGSFVPLFIAVGVFVAACVAVFLVSQVWWAAMGFRLDPEELRLKSGVISTQLRVARYDRVQAVDVVEPLIARLFRLAAVRVETAGGAGSSIEIAYLPRAEANQVRTELLHRVGGEAWQEDTADIPEQEYAVAPIPIARSLVGAALRGTTLVGIAWAAFSLLSPIAASATLPLLVGLVPPVWNMVDRSWRFHARLEGDVLHLAYGLASRRRQAVPLERVHGIAVMQPVLWRPLGWWSVSVSVAGYGKESNSSSGTTRILPVGTRAQAMELVALVGPLAAEEVHRVAQPERATEPTYTSPRRARWTSPLDAHRQAVTLTQGCVVEHRGLMIRRMALIHSSHIQELTAHHGPLQYVLGLSTVRCDVVPGPVSISARELESDHARELVYHLRKRRLPSLSGPILNA